MVSFHLKKHLVCRTLHEGDEGVVTIEILFTEIIHLVSQYFEQSQKTKISQSLSLALVLVQLSNACSLFQPSPPPPNPHPLSHYDEVDCCSHHRGCRFTGLFKLIKHYLKFEFNSGYRRKRIELQFCLALR